MKVGKFSIIQVTEESDNVISGYWTQNHMGTIESARQVADYYQNKPTSQKYGIKFAVISEMPFAYRHFHQTRLA